MPKISVIIPVYNAEKYIREAIYSILFQTYTDFELIIIDDASEDKSLSVIEEIRDDRIVVLRNDKNRGISFTTNRGLEKAKGEYIALLDDDDIAVQDRLWRSAAYLDSHPDIDIVGGNYKILRDGCLNSSNYVSLHNPMYIKARLLFYCELRNGSCMYRKKFVDDHGIRYEEDFYGMQDYRFWTKCAVNGGRMTVLDDIFFIHRMHSDRETVRAINHQFEERKRKYREIQEWIIRKSGFELSTEDMDCLSTYIGERPSHIESISEYAAFHMVLDKLVYQAEQRKMDNAQEIKIACRKIMEHMLWGTPELMWRE